MGRTAAAQSVEVRARVTGYLVKTPFKEGSEVKIGDLLFEIDPRPYKALFDSALSQVELHKASLKLASLNYKRVFEISRNTPGAVSQQELDQIRAAFDEAEARLKASQASLDIARFNLDFTRVHAPINGKVSRYHQTPGNLVTQDQTLLTTIVSLEPMFVYFNMDEVTFLRIYRAISDAKQQPADGLKLIHLGLQGEDGYPHEGTINFIDSRVDANTGGIQVRGVFAKPRPAGGVPLLLPGMSVRVRLPIGSPYSALLLPRRAVVVENGEAFIFVVNAKDTLERRPVQLGPPQEGGLRVVQTGVTAEDLVVLNASPGLKAGQIVQPKKTPVTDEAPKAPPPGQGQP
jgi:membrane fusion protein, multidrug efflux system